MNWVARFLNLLFNTSKTSKSLRSLRNKIERIQKDLDASESKVATRQKELDRVEKSFNEEIKRERDALTDALKLNRKMEESLEAANEHLKTLEDIVVPGLVAANSVLVERFEAEAAIHTMRKVMAKDKDD